MLLKRQWCICKTLNKKLRKAQLISCCYFKRNLACSKIRIKRPLKIDGCMLINSYFDLLYSNSICKHSSMPTSILMGLFISGYVANVWTRRSSSFVMSVSLRPMVTLKKYLHEKKIIKNDKPTHVE